MTAVAQARPRRRAFRLHPRPRPTRAHPARARRRSRWSIGAALAGRDPAVPRGGRRRRGSRTASTSRRPTRGPCSSTSARCSSSTSRSSSPAGGPTRSCCRPSGCWAGSGCCSCSGCRRTSSSSRSATRCSTLGQLQLGVAADRARRHHRARARRPLRRLAADLQVHVGRRRASRCCCSCSCSAARSTARGSPLDRPAVRASRRELLKVILVVFLAGYLSENRALLAEESTRIGPLRLPPVPYLAPMVAMVAIALAIVVVQRDLGAALLFFAVFLALLYVATGRPSYVIGGLLLFVAGVVVLYNLFGHVQTRVDNWLDPWRDPQGAGFQVIQALYAFGRGGILGVGLGDGLPTIGGPPADPRDPHRLPARGAGRGAGPHRPARDPRPVPRRRVSGGCGSRPSAHDDFRSLLAAGLALVDRRPGVHHRGRQPQADPAHRDHAAVHLVRRLVAARERGRRSGCCSRCPTAGAEPPAPPPRDRQRGRRLRAVPPDPCRSARPLTRRAADRRPPRRPPRGAARGSIGRTCSAPASRSRSPSSILAVGAG